MIFVERPELQVVIVNRLRPHLPAEFTGVAKAAGEARSLATQARRGRHAPPQDSWIFSSYFSNAPALDHGPPWGAAPPQSTPPGL